MGVAERDSALDTELQDEEVTEEQVEETGTEEGTETGDEDDEVVVQIGEEEPPASEEEKAAAPWVKELRQQQKQLKRENAELRAKLTTGQPAPVQAPKLPEFPKIADFDYDEDKYQEAVQGWNSTKREVEAHEKNQQEAAKAQQERVRSLNEAYEASKTSLKVKDYDDAEETVIGAFTEWQQSILKMGPANPAAMVYALGKNPKKLSELSSIKDPVKFALAVGKLETEVKVTKRTSTKPAPESTVRGATGAAPATSATLARLEAEADRTGDRTKVAAYRRQQAK